MTKCVLSLALGAAFPRLALAQSSASTKPVADADGAPTRSRSLGVVTGAGGQPRSLPTQIERLDVMYGPFSAAYPGNSAGAVVDFVTRMPTQREAHVKAGYSSQPNDLCTAELRFDL